MQHGGVRKKGVAENTNRLHHYARTVKVEKHNGIIRSIVSLYAEIDSEDLDITSVELQDFANSENLCALQENCASCEEVW